MKAIVFQGATAMKGAPETGTGFAEIVAETVDRIYGFLLGLTGDPDVAADLTQQTFLNVARSYHRHGNDGPSIAYLFTAARNAANSRLRRLKLERRHLRPLSTKGETLRRSATAQPDHHAENAELREVLTIALRELEPDLRAVFLLSEVEGLKYVEIAEILGCKAGTVGSRKHAAIKKLRSELRRMGHVL